MCIGSNWRRDRHFAGLVGNYRYILCRHVFETGSGGKAHARSLSWLLNHPSELFAQLGQLGLVLLSDLYYGALPATLVEAVYPRRTSDRLLCRLFATLTGRHVVDGENPQT